jgi:outer membrane lipoprotein-sorting protein
LLGLRILDTVHRTKPPATRRILTTVFILFLLFTSFHCSWFRVKKTTKVPVSQRALPAKTADTTKLIGLLNSRAQEIQTLNLSVLFELTGGSINTGEIAKYEKTRGFILVKRPSFIRTIVLAFNVRVLDMVSDGVDFEIDVPSKNKFIHGLNNQAFKSGKDVSIQLRPQHMFEALMLDPLKPSSDNEPLDLEEDQEGIRKYYILALHREVSQGQWSLSRKVWFDRLDLSIVRQKLFGEHGQVTSDIIYHDFKNFDKISFPSKINLNRPQEDYSLTIELTKAKINEALSNDKFVLQKPPSAQLIDLAEQRPTP